MIRCIDNKGAKYFCYNWSVGGRTWHIDVKQYFLRELKEAGLLLVKQKSGNEMTINILTNNCTGPIFNHHLNTFVSEEKYTVKDSLFVTTKGRVLRDKECKYRRMTMNQHADLSVYMEMTNLLISD